MLRSVRPASKARPRPDRDGVEGGANRGIPLSARNSAMMLSARSWPSTRRAAAENQPHAVNSCAVRWMGRTFGDLRTWPPMMQEHHARRRRPRHTDSPSANFALAGSGVFGEAAFADVSFSPVLPVLWQARLPRRVLLCWVWVFRPSPPFDVRPIPHQGRVYAPHRGACKQQ